MITSSLNKLSVILVFVLLQGCMQKLDITPAEVVADISASLKPGDSALQIEEHFKSKGLEISYDKFQNRYQSIIRHPDSNYHAITIYIYVGKNKTFERVEANDSYTFL